jgi:putative transposase
MRSGRASSRWCLGVSREPIANANSVGEPAVAASPWLLARSFPPLFMFCERAASGRPCPRVSAAPAPFISISSNGNERTFLYGCGAPVWLSMMSWLGSPGNGRHWTEPRAKPRWRKRQWVTTRPIGGKKGTKRSLLVDGRGAPLSLIVAGANRHDVKLLAQTLDAIVIPRPKPTKRRPQHLCVDKGYAGKPAEQQMRARGYIPHVPKKGVPKTRRKTKPPARRWVVERTHSWMNNYRKLRVRYEKKVANFEALLHLATAMICWRM